MAIVPAIDAIAPPDVQDGFRVNLSNSLKHLARVPESPFRVAGPGKVDLIFWGECSGFMLRLEDIQVHPIVTNSRGVRVSNIPMLSVDIRLPLTHEEVEVHIWR